MLLQGILKARLSGQSGSSSCSGLTWKFSNQGWLATSSRVLVWLCWNCYRVQACSAHHMIGQYIGRWCVGARNKNFNQKASRPRRWQFQKTISPQSQSRLLLQKGRWWAGTHCNTNQRLRGTVSGHSLTVVRSCKLTDGCLLQGGAHGNIDHWLRGTADGSLLIPACLPLPYYTASS